MTQVSGNVMVPKLPNLSLYILTSYRHCVTPITLRRQAITQLERLYGVLLNAGQGNFFFSQLSFSFDAQLLCQLSEPATAGQ